jgi:hypothetical protein
MPVTFTVFLSDGLKRGDPVDNAVFAQWIDLGNKARRLTGLTTSSRTGNVYVVDPITAPLDPGSTATVRVSAPATAAHRNGAADVTVRQADAVEVWI